jgi:hypothetical protein
VTDSEKVAQSAVTIDDHPAQMVEMHIKDGDKVIGDALMLVLDDADGSRAALTLYAAPGELDLWRATALAVAASLRVHLPATN